MIDRKPDLLGIYPESWLCIGCGVNTAPGCFNRQQMDAAAGASGEAWSADGGGLLQKITDQSEVYTVCDTIWEKAGMTPYGGCLCIGCLEKRLGRELKPNDFLRAHPFNADYIPGTARLKQRQGR